MASHDHHSGELGLGGAFPNPPGRRHHRHHAQVRHHLAQSLGFFHQTSRGPPTQRTGPPSPQLQPPPASQNFRNVLRRRPGRRRPDHLPTPRLVNTHFPFHMLSTTAKCKLVFLCRNPGDNFISHWKFHSRILSMAAGSDVEVELSLEEAFDLFCSGRSSYGPYWDSVLEYWQASKQEPERVLFLHYEELKQDPSPHIKRLASFLGVPFTEEEEEKGLVEDIINLCSFDKMSNLEVNKTGKCPTGMPAQVYFRSGSIGDWSKYLTSEMVERLNSITQEKMKGSGLNLIL